MSQAWLVVVTAGVAGFFGFFAAILMMGAKIADENQKEFLEEAKRRLDKNSDR